MVDSGFSRRPQYDVAAGSQHLVTQRSSQASAAQRAGRAARQRPGVAYRLWEEAAHPGRPQFDLPEILTSDLSGLVLTLAKWGVSDPQSLGWLDLPPVPALAAARSRLEKLGALDDEGRITPWGNQVAHLPLDPVHGAAVLFGAEVSQTRDAARLALLAQERGLGGRGEDLLARLDRWNADRSKRADSARKLADRWTRAAERLISGGKEHDLNPALFLAFAMPDNIARRRDAEGRNWLSAGGRGYILDEASSLSRAEWLVIADAQGQVKGARITAAAELTQADVEQHLHYLFEKRTVARWNASEHRVEARLERRLGAITMASGPDPDPDPQVLVDILVEKAVEKLGELLPAELIARALYAGLDALLPERLTADVQDWLAPLLEGRRDLNLAKGALTDALLARLSWDERQRLDKLAPHEFISEAGTRHAIDYLGDDAPGVEVRVQALFGLDKHPMIGDTPLLLKLTSPAGRPIQSTCDLPGFWRGSWREVAKEMKGRYPKHRWPDEPWNEKPSLKTKNSFSRSDS